MARQSRQYPPRIEKWLKRLAQDESMYKHNSPRTQDIGKRFGRLEVIRVVGHTVKGKALVLVHCDCGNADIKRLEAIRNGVKSCGCLQALMQGGKAREQVHIGFNRLIREGKIGVGSTVAQQQFTNAEQPDQANNNQQPIIPHHTVNQTLQLDEQAIAGIIGSMAKESGFRSKEELRMELRRKEDEEAESALRNGFPMFRPKLE